MRYFDSGARAPGSTLLDWLQQVLSDAIYFGCQTGYFNGDGLYAIETDLRRILSDEGQVRLVVGANEDSLSSQDLEYALDLIEPFGSQASLVVVSAADVLMHPKTYYVERADGSKAAMIGSANLTHSGLAVNIEAGIEVESGSDSGAPFNAIRDAIEVWRTDARPNGYVVTRDNLARLVAAGVVDRPRPIKPRTRERARRIRRMFPRLGPVHRLGRRPRPRAVLAPQARPVPRPGAQPRVRGAPSALPLGAVGLVKQLSPLDTKGFRSERGTLYISLPVALLDLLPTVPAGRNNEPRFDVPILARLFSVPRSHVSSGDVNTNITGVGMGPIARSHRDLRLNILKVIVSGIESVAMSNGVPVPKAGDYVLVELPVSTPELRLTFVERAQASLLASQLNFETGRLRWAWLPVGVSPAW